MDDDYQLEPGVTDSRKATKHDKKQDYTTEAIAITANNLLYNICKKQN